MGYSGLCVMRDAARAIRPPIVKKFRTPRPPWRFGRKGPLPLAGCALGVLQTQGRNIKRGAPRGPAAFRTRAPARRPKRRTTLTGPIPGRGRPPRSAPCCGPAILPVRSPQGGGAICGRNLGAKFLYYWGSVARALPEWPKRCPLPRPLVL